MTILVVTKEPNADRYRAGDLDRLEACGVHRRAELAAAATRHRRTLDQVLATLADHEHRVVGVAALAAGEVATDFDLLVTVGGDGTVLAAQAVVGSQSVLAVNSDPERSIGHFTRCHGDGFADLLDAWRGGRTTLEQLHRLQVQVADKPARTFLNDCLITNVNPAMMSRYLLECGTIAEEQFSSGLWVSTASGATGGIASAGMVAQIGQRETLLFKVREPFHRRGPYQLLDGVQQPPRGLVITPTVPGMAAYVDGGHHHHGELPAGTPIRIGAAPEPLHLVAPGH